MLLGRGEARPVVAGEQAAPLGDLVLRQPGDLPVHLAVAHAVGALDGPGGDPEEALAEDPVVLRGGLGPGGPHEVLVGDGQLGGVAEDDAVPDDVARLLEEALGQVAGDLVPGRDAQPGRLAPLGFEPVLERLVGERGPLGVVLDEVLARRLRQGRLLSRGGGGVVLLANEAGSKATSTGGSGPPGSTVRAEAEQHAVLEVGVGQEQDHRRGLLLAEVLDQARRTRRR